MKFSEQWLREWVKTPLDTETLLQRLTMAGHELEAVEASIERKDNIIDIDFTPNRGDCLSVMGVAREAAAVIDGDYTPLTIAPVANKSEMIFPITVQSPEDCPRYIGRVIEDINIHAETPAWIMQRLTDSGIRSIDPVVDVTNYVMLELGQPLHAFDKNMLHNSIIVRRAKQNETLTLLNEQKITLSSDILVIADEHKVLALAGIMGGQHSGVSNNTKTIFLESAYFNPLTIAGRALRYGLHTDSSHRFERGVDFELPRQAIERATALLVQIVGGKPGVMIEQSAPTHLPTRQNITLRKQRAERLLGITIETVQIESLLRRLNFAVQPQQKDTWQIQAPSYRFDINQEVDLIEEVARLYGYSNIPTNAAATQISEQHLELSQNQARMRALLISHGYQEIISYSFVEPKLQQLLQPENKPIELINPISAEMAVMRNSLWPGLLSVARYNQNRQQERVRLFEIGQCFNHINIDGEINQDVRIAGLITGSAFPEQWGVPQRSTDFFDIKGDVENLLKVVARGKQIQYQASSHPALHPGQSCQIICDGSIAGYIGALNPQIMQSIDQTEPVYLFECFIKTIVSKQLPNYQPLGKFPAIRRDIALIADSGVTAQQIQDVVIASAGELLRDVQIFDVYQGPGVELGKKSIALALILQSSERTLKDEEVNMVMDHVLAALTKTLQTKLRD